MCSVPMSKLFLTALLARARAMFLPAIVTSSCLAVAPASAAVVGADASRGSVLRPVVVSIESHTEFVASILVFSKRRVLEVAGRPFVVAWDLNHDRPSHAQAPFKPRRRRARGSPLQHAFRFGADRRLHGNAPTTQATSSGAVGLHDPPLGPATPASRFVVLLSSERIPFNARTGRRASRAPPLFTI
jgi:hypothetical protein